MPPIFQSAAGQLNVWVEQRALLITWVVLGAAAAAMAQRAPLHKDGRIQRHGAQGADEPGQGGAQLGPGVGADEDGGACGAGRAAAGRSACGGARTHSMIARCSKVNDHRSLSALQRYCELPQHRHTRCKVFPRPAHRRRCLRRWL